jgi:DNA-directed RNA polymerase subunit RPC12/RpoP
MLRSNADSKPEICPYCGEKTPHIRYFDLDYYYKTGKAKIISYLCLKCRKTYENTD